MFRSLTLFLALLMITGCFRAKMVVRPGNQSIAQFAPVNEEQRPGIIKYGNGGFGFQQKQQRDSAYRQMYESCSGKYRILNESAKTEGLEIATDQNGKATASESEYVYIKFECVK